MKKKLRDLSLKEIDKICEKHTCNLECPLVIGCDDITVFCVKDELGKEVEIDE